MNSFVFKQFTVKQNNCAMKVGTDAVLLGAWAKLPATGFALDVGTGTGIIAMMLAQRSNATIDAIELEQHAYQQAAENCGNCKWGNRINVHHASFQHFFTAHTKKYDVIISNPPFFADSLHSPSQLRTMARHTCNLSFQELVTGVVSLLNMQGSFATILPAKESETLVDIAKKEGLNLVRLTHIKTTVAKPAKRALMEFSFSGNYFLENTLVIENNNHSYTSEYKQLTGDFYLGF